MKDLRSHASMARIAGELRPFGACDVAIAERKLEPRLESRGDSARIS